jgi:mRNA-degrading endonuclease toxin of MazEF toxin-antitoxin module
VSLRAGDVVAVEMTHEPAAIDPRLEMGPHAGKEEDQQGEQKADQDEPVPPRRVVSTFSTRDPVHGALIQSARPDVVASRPTFAPTATAT